MAAVVRPVPELPAATTSLPGVPLPTYSLVDAPRPASPSQLPVPAPDVSAPELLPPGSGSSTQLLDEPLPPSADQFRVLTPDVSAISAADSHADQPVVAEPGSVTPARTHPAHACHPP